MTDIEISRRERKKEETRQRIFKAAIKLFRDRGFDSTTVDEITERADVAKGTFFNHFPRKEAVLGFLSEQRLELAEANAEAVLAAPQPAREKLVEIYVDASRAYAEDRELSRFVLNELLQRAFSPAEDTGQRWESLIARVFEQGQAAGDLRRDVDPLRAIALLSSVYYATLFMWAHCVEQVIDLEQELRSRLALVMDGIAARRPGGAHES